MIPVFFFLMYSIDLFISFFKGLMTKIWMDKVKINLFFHFYLLLIICVGRITANKKNVWILILILYKLRFFFKASFIYDAQIKSNEAFKYQRNQTRKKKRRKRKKKKKKKDKSNRINTHISWKNKITFFPLFVAN